VYINNKKNIIIEVFNTLILIHKQDNKIVEFQYTLNLITSHSMMSKFYINKSPDNSINKYNILFKL